MIVATSEFTANNKVEYQSDIYNRPIATRWLNTICVICYLCVKE